jgi:hypothetical protein
MTGKLQQLPQWNIFSQFFNGKNQQQQIETFLNMAKENGIDVNAKMFTAQDLKQLGLNVTQNP